MCRLRAIHPRRNAVHDGADHGVFARRRFDESAHQGGYLLGGRHEAGVIPQTHNVVTTDDDLRKQAFKIEDYVNDYCNAPTKRIVACLARKSDGG